MFRIRRALSTPSPAASASSTAAGPAANDHQFAVDPGRDNLTPVRGLVDLHCHWVAGIDDGARTPAEGIAMLEGLRAAGFDLVVATPHMRPGMFENTRSDLERAFQRMAPSIEGRRDLPRVALSSEHYFDDIVYARLLAGEALPYPGERSVLLEFYDMGFPPTIEHRLLDLRRRKLLPVIAHPERYREIWQSADRLERLVEAGATALLDTAALIGKYGKMPRRSAEELLERGLYHAACSDAHRPNDVAEVMKGMKYIERKYGPEEVQFLFCEGPQALLAGHVPE
jgi:protein-tyrosine phosphatase